MMNEWLNITKMICENLHWRFLTEQCSGRLVGVDSNQIRRLLKNKQMLYDLGDNIINIK